MTDRIPSNQRSASAHSAADLRATYSHEGSTPLTVTSTTRDSYARVNLESRPCPGGNRKDLRASRRT